MSVRRMAAARAIGARAGWTILDQAVSSAATALLSVVVARSVSATQYGEFALAFSLYGLFTAVSQAVNGQVLAIRFPGTGGRRNPETAAAGGAAVITGMVFGAALLVASSLTSSSIRHVLLPLGLLLPLLLLQDLWRSSFVTGGRPQHAFYNDVAWVVLQACFVGALLLGGSGSAAHYLTAWAGAGLIAAGIGVYQSGSRPSLALGRRWLFDHASASGPLLGVAIATVGAGQVGLLLVGAFGSVEDVGAIRASQTLLGPLNIVGFGLAAFAVPELGRRAMTNGRNLILAASAVSSVFVAVTVIWGIALLILPDRWGVLLLGDTWPLAERAIPGMALSMCFLALTVGPSVVIRALDRSSLLLTSGILLGVLLIVLPSLGVTRYGIEGAAMGNALASGLIAGPYWWLLSIAIRRGRRVPLSSPSAP